MRFIAQNGVKTPTRRDRIKAARAYLRKWDRPFLCWRIAGECDSVPLLRFGGPEFDIPTESRTASMEAHCRLYWDGEAV